jgi:hypothetical protein
MSCTETQTILLSCLAVKFPNSLNQSFSHLLWSYWVLSPSKYSLTLFIHRSQNFWKHSWNTSFGVLRSCAGEFLSISSTDSNRRRFSKDFRERKKCAGARSGERTWCQVLWENRDLEWRTWSAEGATFWKKNGYSEKLNIFLYLFQKPKLMTKFSRSAFLHREVFH